LHLNSQWVCNKTATQKQENILNKHKCKRPFKKAVHTCVSLSTSSCFCVTVLLHTHRAFRCKFKNCKFVPFFLCYFYANWQITHKSTEWNISIFPATFRVVKKMRLKKFGLRQSCVSNGSFGTCIHWPQGWWLLT